MDDRTYGTSDRHMRYGGAGADRGPAPAPERDHGSGPDFDFDALARSLAGTDHSSVSVPLVVAAGVLVALTALSLMYGWPLWAGILCIVALVALMGAAMLRRPPVAPLELTSHERDRVRRVLDEHGARAAVALVRALYPGESGAAATKTVRLLLERR